MNQSIRLIESPIEFINITPVNPLISKCEIKVCWVGEEPNRNGSIITEEVARDMANSLPGCPIVGYYNEDKQDFEGHNRIIDLSNGEFKIKDTTRPYGFVDLNAKVWFAMFKDFDNVERKYLMTEGYLWTEQYPECKRILNSGNNQSMELDEKTLNAFWTEDNNNNPQFFIINEAIISKLCILGENTEPCFEGSHITTPTIHFSFENGFKEQLFSMLKELKELIKEGGAPVFSRYNVSVGDTLWNNVYNYLNNNHPSAEENVISVYRIDGIYEEEEQKFVVLQHKADEKFYRLNFSIGENDEFIPAETLVEITSTYSVEDESQFNQEDVENFENSYFLDETHQEEDNNPENNTGNEENNSNEQVFEEEQKEEEKCPKCHKPIDECTCEEEKKSSYNLDEVVEYQELNDKYIQLQEQFNLLNEENQTLTSQIEALTVFKKNIERKEKQTLIDSFYMLSDEDKADVIANIDTYSLNDIEAKLSIICVRNKVSFSQDEDTKGPTVYSLENDQDFDTPAWVKRALSVAKDLNN